MLLSQNHVLIIFFYSKITRLAISPVLLSEIFEMTFYFLWSVISVRYSKDFINVTTSDLAIVTSENRIQN